MLLARGLIRSGLLLTAGIAVFIGLSLSTAYAKPPEGVSIKLSVGYNGWVARSQVNPVIVDLENNSQSTNLSGDLILEHNGIEYTTPLNLPTPSKKRFHLYFPCDNWPPLLELRVRTKQYSEQFELLDNRDFKTMESGDASVVVLTRQSGSLGVLNQLPIARLNRDLYRELDATLAGGKVFVSYFNVDEIDNNPKFFSQADTVILADIDYQQVTAELAETLKACAAGGTNIVFSLGISGLGVAGSPVSELCPLVPRETVQLSDLGGFGASYGISAQNAQATFATGDIRPGAAVVRMAGGFPAVVRWNYGGGSVTALAFDYTTQPFKQHPGVGQLMLDNSLTISQSAGVDDWFAHPEPIARVLRELGAAKPLLPGFVALFLVAYVVLIGPVNFLALGKLKRRTLVWVTIPSLIIAFSYVGLSTGYLYRGGNNITAHMQEIHIYPGTDYAAYQTVMLVFTAERTRYSLEIPDRSAFIYPDIPLVLDQWQFNSGAAVNRMRGLGGGRIDNSTLPLLETVQNKWTQKDYMYRGNMALNAGVECQLTASRSKDSLTNLSGTLTLDLPFDLEDCQLLAPDYEKSIRRVAGRGTYNIADIGSSGTSQLDEDNYLVRSRYDFRRMQKNAARPGLNYRDEILLTGFTQDVKALADFGRPHIGNELSMVVIHLPYKPVIPEVGPLQISRTRLGGGSGFEPFFRGYGSRNRSYGSMGQYSLAEKGFIDMQFEIAGRVQRDSKINIDLSGLVDPGTEADILDITKNIDVYVRIGEAWQELRVPDGSRFVDVAVAPTIDGNRIVTVRLVAKQYSVLELPKASAYRQN